MNPSPELYRLVRSGFVAQGSTLHQWCLAHGVKRQNARAVLLGEWQGKRATVVLTQLIADSGVRSIAHLAALSTATPSC